MSLIPGRQPPALSDRVAALLELDDYLGVGNLMLEVLMRPGQDRRPDEDAAQLAAVAPGIVARMFGIPEGLSYPCPYRDRHLAHADRGDWERDDFVMLIILAYVLGATRENLPPPHDTLVPYYRKTADEQRRLLDQVAKKHQERIRRVPPKPTVAQDQLLAILQNQTEDPETKLQAIAALLAGEPPKPVVRVHEANGIV